MIPAPTASAAPTDSPILVRALAPAAGSARDAEWVMLQMTVPGQQGVTGETLTFYGPAGAITDTYSIPGDVANGQSQRTILLAPLRQLPREGSPSRTSASRPAIASTPLAGLCA